MPKLSPTGGDAAKQTDAQFAQELSQLTSLTDQEIKDLFPQKQDAEAFQQALQAVNAAADANERKVKIIENIDKFVGFVAKLGEKAATGL